MLRGTGGEKWECGWEANRALEEPENEVEALQHCENLHAADLDDGKGRAADEDADLIANIENDIALADEPVGVVLPISALCAVAAASARNVFEEVHEDEVERKPPNFLETARELLLSSRKRRDTSLCGCHRWQGRGLLGHWRLLLRGNVDDGGGLLGFWVRHKRRGFGWDRRLWERADHDEEHQKIDDHKRRNCGKDDLVGKIDSWKHKDGVNDGTKNARPSRARRPRADKLTRELFEVAERNGLAKAVAGAHKDDRKQAKPEEPLARKQRSDNSRESQQRSHAHRPHSPLERRSLKQKHVCD